MQCKIYLTPSGNGALLICLLALSTSTELTRAFHVGRNFDNVQDKDGKGKI